VEICKKNTGEISKKCGGDLQQMRWRFVKKSVEICKKKCGGDV
jgi:hypothetical protein